MRRPKTNISMGQRRQNLYYHHARILVHPLPLQMLFFQPRLAPRTFFLSTIYTLLLSRLVITIIITIIITEVRQEPAQLLRRKKMAKPIPVRLMLSGIKETRAKCRKRVAVASCPATKMMKKLMTVNLNGEPHSGPVLRNTPDTRTLGTIKLLHRQRRSSLVDSIGAETFVHSFSWGGPFHILSISVSSISCLVIIPCILYYIRKVNLRYLGDLVWLTHHVRSHAPWSWSSAYKESSYLWCALFYTFSSPSSGWVSLNPTRAFVLNLARLQGA